MGFAMGGVDEERERALDRVLELTVLLGHDMAHRLAREQLTPARVGILWGLRRQGPQTQRDLARGRDVTPRNITGLVDGLVTTGLVSRAAHPTDRRATLVTLTDQGTRLVEQLEREQREFAHLLFDGMPGRQFDGLVDGLDEILRRIKLELQR